MSGPTKKCQYALKALALLAREYGHGPVMLRRISAETGAPLSFLQIILLEIRNAGLLSSKRGSQGGYYLLTPPDQLTVGSIVQIVDGPFLTSPCLATSEANRCRDCHQPNSCQTRRLMLELNDAVGAVLNRTTLLQCCNL